MENVNYLREESEDGRGRDNVMRPKTRGDGVIVKRNLKKKDLGVHVLNKAARETNLE